MSFYTSAVRPADEGLVGVLLSNLGTPDAPTPAAVRRYLREFLSDPRVVELPRPAWWLVLNLLVLPFRPRRSARLYAKVWAPGGSPLLAISRRQAAGVRERLVARAGDGVRVALGMRYGEPSIAAALDELRQQGCARILVLPLYPQHSAATTGSTFDAVGAALATWRRVPELRTVASYALDGGYLSALAASFTDAWAAEPPAERVLLSFHGLPERYARAGDPYPEQCRATAEALAALLGLPPGRLSVAFQSRFGREPWLQPYTDQTLAAWARGGVGRVDVACPGFSADCLETLEEIALANREVFLSCGGKAYRYLPALNDRDDHLDALAAIAERNLCGWLGPGSPAAA